MKCERLCVEINTTVTQCEPNTISTHDHDSTSLYLTQYVLDVCRDSVKTKHQMLKRVNKLLSS